MPLIASGATDIGRKRKTNQDAICFNVEKHYFVVADGMGGHNGGDIASQMATKHIPEFLLGHWNLDPTLLVSKSIQETNRTIKEFAEKNPDLQGMGTTVVSFLFRGPYLYVGNVGDSRAYLVNKQRLYQLSRDHSLVQEKLNYGIYNREQAALDPQKNVLVKTVGFEDDIDVDVFTYKVNKNDIFLICSDGLHGKVSDEDIVFIINQNIPEPAKVSQAAVDRCVKALIQQANDNGGNDNISVILVVAI